MGPRSKSLELLSRIVPSVPDYVTEFDPFSAAPVSLISTFQAAFPLLALASSISFLYTPKYSAFDSPEKLNS